jgi:hypothetical protein
LPTFATWAFVARNNNLEDNAYNRRILKKRLEQLEAEITLGTFEYENTFQKVTVLRRV